MSEVGEKMDGSQGAKGDVGATLQQGATSAGVGKEAFFDSNQLLHVLDKNAYFTVAPPMMRSRMGPGNPMLSDQERRDMATAIAQKVAAALYLAAAEGSGLRRRLMLSARLHHLPQTLPTYALPD